LQSPENTPKQKREEGADTKVYGISAKITKVLLIEHGEQVITKLAFRSFRNLQAKTIWEWTKFLLVITV
tara:strand:+ start:2344 stop:2550 length:207 start_codon:yes stop_codon:yes gene_type:complete